MPSVQERKLRSFCRRRWGRARKCFHDLLPKWTAAPRNGSQFCRVLVKCDSQCLPRRRPSTWLRAIAAPAPDSLARSTADPPACRAVPGSSVRERPGLAPVFSRRPPCRVAAWHSVFPSLVPVACVFSYSKYSEPRMLSCGGVEAGGGEDGGTWSSEFLRMDSALL